MSGEKEVRVDKESYRSEARSEARSAVESVVVNQKLLAPRCPNKKGRGTTISTEGKLENRG